jgi:hypothetical protein
MLLTCATNPSHPESTARIHYPYREPGRFEVEINGDPTEAPGDAAPFNDLQFFRCLNGRIFAVTFPAPEEVKVYELVNLDVYHQDE